MDPKVIEMNNLRVLNDYLNQTLDVLMRGSRSGHPTGFGYSPFGPVPSGAGTIGADVVYGPTPYGFTGTPFAGQTPFAGMPFAGQTPFTGTPFAGQTPFTGTPFAGQSPFAGTPFAAQNPFTGLPVVGPGYGAVDPFFAQRAYAGSFGGWQQPWGQTPWTQGQIPWGPMTEATRQAQYAHALAAKQSVLEAMCRYCGIPV